MRLRDVKLRKTWGQGCRDTQWRLILEDLRFPRHGPDAAYTHPAVTIDEIIRALDARPYVPASTSSTSKSADADLVARIAAMERQLKGRGPSRLNLVAFSGQAEDSLGRPLKRPPPSSSRHLKEAYVSHVLTAAHAFAAKHPELELDTNFDTYELSRLLDDPPPSDYEEGPLEVLVVE
ncbi:hypothetical protein HDU96_005147, partial [Phlyctochytrium bullatum]